MLVGGCPLPSSSGDPSLPRQAGSATVRKRQMKDPRLTAKPKLTKHPINCQICNHDMGRSKAKAAGLDSEGNPTWTVRCNNCKTAYTATARFPKQNTP